MLQVYENTVRLTSEILASYEKNIAATGALIDNTYEILQESEKELEKVRSQLRETLAGSASLRKKDFDMLIANILPEQREKYLEIKRGLNEFVNVHKEAASQLQGLLTRTQSGELVDFGEVLSYIQTQHDEAERKVTSLLRDFRDKHEAIITEVHGLSNDNRPAELEDFKAVLRKIRVRQTAKIN